LVDKIIIEGVVALIGREDGSEVRKDVSTNNVLLALLVVIVGGFVLVGSLPFW